jgi:hypothetical protein
MFSVDHSAGLNARYFSWRKIAGKLRAHSWDKEASLGKTKSIVTADRALGTVYNKSYKVVLVHLYLTFLQVTSLCNGGQ